VFEYRCYAIRLFITDIVVSSFVLFDKDLIE
jgi:hypothetical protein